MHGRREALFYLTSDPAHHAYDGIATIAAGDRGAINDAAARFRWRHEVRLRGADAAFTPLTTPTATLDYEARIAELERVCGKLAVENAALKKALQRVQSKPGTNL